MEDGKSTGPKAKWWSRPTPGRTTRTAPDGPTPVADPADAPTDAITAPDAGSATEATEAAAGSGTAEPQPGVATADAPPAPAPGPVPDVPAARLTKPLHEPDEYSTPPYGGPGPWAPAPPVQRPVPTPAHGTPVPPQYAGTN
ncbi:protease, partial [Streptomyces sp. CLV115]